MSRFPWNNNTSEDIAEQTNPRYETPQGAQIKADEARDQAVEIAEAALDLHKAMGADEHPLATVTEAGFMSAEDKQKADSSAFNAEPNQNAFANINGITASNESDQILYEQGTGISITTDVVGKKIKFTATGTSTPGQHAESHLTNGSDPIPIATTDTDGLAPKSLMQRIRQPGIFYVTDPEYGAKRLSSVDDTAAIQSCINNASATGGGTVIFPPGDYYLSGTLTVPSGVGLYGFGSLGDGHSIGQLLGGLSTTFYITNTTNPFITITGQSVSIRGLSFYYPNQVAVTSSTPIVYPYTIKIGSGGGPGVSLRDLNFVNAYEAIDFSDVSGGAGRSVIENTNLGCLKTGIHIDNCLDTIRLNKIQITPFYSVGAAIGSTFPTALDNWSMLNGNGIIIRRADGVIMDNIFIFAKFCGIALVQTTNPDLTTVKGSYGSASNIAMDYVDIGIRATNTNVYGWDFTGFHCAPVAPNGQNKCVIKTQPGGTMEPKISFVNGSAWGVANSVASLESGEVSFASFRFRNDFAGGYFNTSASATIKLSINNCDFEANATSSLFGITKTIGGFHFRGNKTNGNTTNLIPGTNIPNNARIKDNDFRFAGVSTTLPASGVVWTNNFGIPIRLFISGGTVSGVSVNGIDTGLSSGMFILEPQDTLSITYTTPPARFSAIGF